MKRAILAEALGTAVLLAVVVGSGIMGESLSGGNVAVALLANSLATGAGLYVLVGVLGPISGAHFNPLVTLMFALDGQLARNKAAAFVAAQMIGGVLGVWLTHAVFGHPIVEGSTHVRAQLLSEVIASACLLGVIRVGVRVAPERMPILVALTVTSGYWFTASTFFANPAVTVARAFSDTFAGIAPASVPGFVGAQLLGLLIVAAVDRLLKGPHEHPTASLRT